ncbi:hypothetical protein [Geotalea sp. SG265]|uniref:hypothetical protein n=1 Tax=Geotalea sp. SG265 TaxID=2922867 RepID=UPI001FAEA8DB|nr:hypothetical protein [Geotalea sp. SG265]
MIILLQKYGQLGNRLSYLREFFAIALEHDLDVVFFSFDEYAHYFSGTKRGLVCSFPCGRGLAVDKRVGRRCRQLLLNIIIRVLSEFTAFTRGIVPQPEENGCHVFNADFVERIQKKKIVLFLEGWPCVRPEIIEKHAVRIREYFSLVQEHALRVDAFLHKAKDHGDFVVGIHMRMGDYRYWNDGKFFFTVDEYIEVMRTIIEKHKSKSIVFILCTNEDQEWSRFEEFTYLVGPGDTIGDLYVLAGCNEIYGPQSSYSAWASFYGKVPFYEMRSDSGSGRGCGKNIS